MKLRFIVLLLLALAAFPALAQDSVNHSLTYDGFGFSYDTSVASSVNITQFAGDAPDVQQPGGPEVAHTKFVLYSEPPVPEFGAPAEIRVYRTTDFAGYEYPSQQLQQLQTLLTDRPDLASFTEVDISGENALPFMPSFAASQVIRTQASYVDTPSFSGIGYVTVYRQDVSPFAAQDFLYTFQGVSSDGATYVSAVFQLNTALFPAEIPADFDYNEFSANYEQYVIDSVAALNAASPTDFTPSLDSLNRIVQSFSLTSGSAPAPTPEATEPAGDAGELEGSWTLVSYGDPASPTAVLPAAPVTISFAADGVSGNASCNSYSGSFQFENDSITFGNIVMTEMACTDEGVMAQETAYLAALQTTSAYQVTDGQLQITYDGGVLTFISEIPLPEVTTDPGDPTLGGLAGTWTLVSYGDPANPTQVVGTTPVTLILASDGVSGNAGCNQYGAPTFIYQNGTLQFSQIVSTLVACTDESVMAQESVYLAALQAASAYTLTDGQLQISYDGGVLNFVAG